MLTKNDVLEIFERFDGTDKVYLRISAESPEDPADYLLVEASSINTIRHPETGEYVIVFEG